MLRPRLALTLFFLTTLSLSLGCGDTPNIPGSRTGGRVTGQDPIPEDLSNDAGPGDAGDPEDAGGDAGPGRDDDGGLPEDGGEPDGGSSSDGGVDRKRCDLPAKLRLSPSEAQRDPTVLGSVIRLVGTVKQGEIQCRPSPGCDDPAHCCEDCEAALWMETLKLVAAPDCLEHVGCLGQRCASQSLLSCTLEPGPAELRGRLLPAAGDQPPRFEVLGY